MELQELIAFNDEIVALSRAGIPIGEGLMHTSHNLPDRMGKVAERVSHLMQQGQSLESVFDACPDEFPAHYRAVVRAGVRSGKLTTASESLATSLRRMSELRSVVANSLFYPLIVVCCALILFATCVSHTLVVLRDSIDGHRLTDLPVTKMWLDFSTSLGNWLGYLPALIVVAAFIWWWRSGRSRIATMAPSSMRFAWIPGAAGLLRSGQQAMFTEVLASLIRQDVPLNESLVLAAEATDGKQLHDDARELAERIEKGDTTVWRSNRKFGIPPLVAWLVGNNHDQRSLPDTLQRLANGYFQRAQRRGNLLRTALPVLTTLGIAGVSTMAYAGSFLFPWMSILSRLSEF